MLNAPTLEKLNGMRMTALAAAWEKQQEDVNVMDLGFVSVRPTRPAAPCAQPDEFGLSGAP